MMIFLWNRQKSSENLLNINCTSLVADPKANSDLKYSFELYFKVGFSNIVVQLDCLWLAPEQKNNFPTNQEGYDKSETTAKIVSKRRMFWEWALSPLPPQN